MTHLTPPHLPLPPDHCDIRSKPEIVKLLAKHGEPRFVLFSEEVLKINRRGEAKPRVMVVAQNSVFLLDASTLRVRRKIPIKRLSSIRMSEYSDNFLALIHPEEYDVLLVCGRKIEATVAMTDAFTHIARESKEKEEFSEVNNPTLPVEFSGNFTYAAGADLRKRVTFTRLDNGEVDTTIADITRD